MSNTSHRICIAGASGRMGRMLIEAVQNADDCVLSGALDVPTSPALGQDASAFLGRASGVAIASDLDHLAGSHVLIDFTRPEGTMEHLRACVRHGVKLVIGTTGFSDEQKAEIADAAKSIAIVMAPNMSVGVNVTLKLLEMAAKAMATGYDIEIVEAHHRHKVDAPSGTALKMGEVIADAIGRDLKECAVYERYGHTGERDPSSIGFATVRGGGVGMACWVFGAKRLQLFRAGLQLGQRLVVAPLVQRCHKLRFGRQLVGLDACQRVAVKKHRQFALLRRLALALEGEYVVPAVGVEHAGQQRGAQHTAHLLARHARLQRLGLFPRNDIALQNVDFVRGDDAAQRADRGAELLCATVGAARQGQRSQRGRSPAVDV